MLRRLHARTALATRPNSVASASSFWFGSSSVGSTGPEVTVSPLPPVHVPVLLEETVALVGGAKKGAEATAAPKHFVDGTAGFGGHSRALLQRYPTARLLCVDRDPEVLAIARANLHDFRSRVSFAEGSYLDLPAHLAAAGFPQEVDGILVDLGANSFHFDEARRGFSVLHDGPLDMRFDQQDTTLVTAADAVNSLSEVQLTKIFRDYGEERLAKEFAKAIVREREEKHKMFRTTSDLRECIERIGNMWNRPAPSKGSPTKASPRAAHKKKKALKKAGKAGSTHPATRCFQALRIYVNDELKHVEDGVRTLTTHLALNGRLVTIAFHSLEDRPIKDFFRTLDAQGVRRDEDEDEGEFDWEEDEASGDGADDEDVDALGLGLGKKRFQLVRRKATKAKAEEIASNPRARSARLRCIERVQ